MSEAKSGTSGLDVCSAAVGSVGHNLAVSRSILIDRRLSVRSVVYAGRTQPGCRFAHPGYLLVKQALEAESRRIAAKAEQFDYESRHVKR
jgi:hypothetical protein